MHRKKLGEDAQGNEIYGDKYEVLDGAVYKDTGKAVESGTIDEYGKVFYLKPDESAVFEKLQANRKYYVIELGVKY